MDGAQSPKGKAVRVAQADQDQINRLHTQVLEQRNRLKRAREQVAEDEEALQVVSRRKNVMELQLHHQKYSIRSLETDITRQIALCSAQLLHPVLHRLQTKLPYELREMIYENLVDISLPRIVPEAEGSAEDGLNQHIGPAAAFGPFRNEPVFDSYVMGSQISIEIREFFIKRAPLYFRGWHNTQHINVLLDAVVSPEKLVRDLTQNMRMYLRCETFDNDISSYVDRSPLMCATHEEQQSHGEHLLYDTYRKRVRALEKLAFGNRKIKLEICIFQSLYEVPALVGFPTKSKDMRRLYNILEAIKPTYFCVKDQGAQVTVRCENFYSGEGLDMTWVLDADAEAWKTPREPVYALNKHDEPPVRRDWVEKIAAACELQPQLDLSTNISWKHALFEGVFPSCPCSACREALFNDVGELTDCTFDFDAFLQDSEHQNFGEFDFYAVPAALNDL